jgi:copper chaperone CopZ
VKVESGGGDTRERLEDSCGEVRGVQRMVEDELNEIPGVEKTNANVASGTVEVSYDEGSVGTEDLEGAIEEAGYTVAA